MKAYGHSRHDKLECDQGCCTFKSGRQRNCRKVVDKAHRKTARREDKLSTTEELQTLIDSIDF